MTASAPADALLRRALLLRFALHPPPASTAASLVHHARLAECVAPLGAVVHYRQACCPLTKVRLPPLTVVLDDYTRGTLPPTNVDFAGPLSPLEARLLAAFKDDAAMRLVSASRSTAELCAAYGLSAEAVADLDDAG